MRHFQTQIEPPNKQTAANAGTSPFCEAGVSGLAWLRLSYGNKKEATMNTIIAHLRFLGFLSLAQCCLWPAIGADATVPVAVDKGFRLLKGAGPVAAFEAWREGGVLDDGTKTPDEANKFKEMVKPLRNYRSYEVIEAKEIGKTSKLLYVSMSFERGVLYGSFLVWKSDENWLVQRMEFNMKPEVIMPWLLLRGAK